jgi:hypothetical protein
VNRDEDEVTIAELRQWLVERGYVVLSDRYEPDAFGNQLITLARPAALRLVKDRGEWAVEVCGRDGQWRWLGDWSAALGHERPSTTSAREESERLRALLDEIERQPDASDDD